MEFVMLDAYERITLEAGARGLYRTTFTVPDTYGIFKFRVHYRRPGYTVLSFSTQARLLRLSRRTEVGEREQSSTRVVNPIPCQVVIIKQVAVCTRYCVTVPIKRVLV